MNFSCHVQVILHLQIFLPQRFFADRQIVSRARRLQRFLAQPFAVTEAFTGTPGVSVRRADTLAGVKAILEGETDDWAESSLYMVGALEDARAKEAAAAGKAA